MTRIWYDTEFLEDGRTIELISIGMVREDGRELYAVAQEIEDDPLYDRIRRHPWLMENVVPHLPLRAGRGNPTGPDAQYPGHFSLDSDSNVIMPRRMIRNAVRELILDVEKPELWAWYGAYDHVALAQLWGPMISLPQGVPMWTNDLRQEVARRGDPRLPEQSSEEHHALADARWVRDAHLWLDRQ